MALEAVRAVDEIPNLVRICLDLSSGEPLR
jgi:hypothetical protein